MFWDGSNQANFVTKAVKYSNTQYIFDIIQWDYSCMHVTLIVRIYLPAIMLRLIIALALLTCCYLQNPPLAETKSAFTLTILNWSFFISLLLPFLDIIFSMYFVKKLLPKLPSAPYTPFAHPRTLQKLQMYVMLIRKF